MIYEFDAFALDSDRLELRRGGDVQKVDPIVLRVLSALLRGAGRLVTKDELVNDVWGGRVVADNVITVSMARLRKVLQDRRGENEYVVTVYGRGYRFVRPVARRTREARDETPPPTSQLTPLVGRANVLAELRRGAAEAAAGRGRLHVLMGEPGIGKSRVAHAFADELTDSHAQVAWGFCRESGSTPPLYPWLQILRKIFDTVADDAWPASLEPVVAELRALLQETGAPAAAMDAATSQPTPPPAWLPRLRNIGAIARVFTHAAEVTPWVLVLEDLHRADAASLELMSLLVDEIGRSRVLMLATVRDAPAGRLQRPGTALPYVLGHSNTERVRLERLSEQDVQQYVADVAEDTTGRLAHAVYTKSQGNPFFMTELVRQVRYDDDPDYDRLMLPDAALDIVRQRVAALDPETRAMLTAAAVVGTRFELPILQIATGQPASAIARALDDAIASDVIVASPDSVTAFSFAHELLRSVLYEALPPPERRRRHFETALALEHRSETAHCTVPPSELADHFYAAMPETDLDKTVRYCDEAALAAGTVFANTDVARYLQHALAAMALTPSPSVQQRTSLLLRLAIYSRGSRPDIFLSAIQEVVTLARRTGDYATLVRAAMLYHVHPEFSAVSGASEALNHALTIIPEDQPALRACALAALATASPHAHSAKESSRLLAESERLARAASKNDGLQTVLICRLYSEGGPKHDDATAKVIVELDRIARQHPQRSPIIPLFMAVHRAVRMLQQGDLRETSAAIASGLARARTVRHPELLWHFQRFEALAHVNAGHLEEGRAQLEKLHRHRTHHPVLGSCTFHAFDRAVVLPALGVPLHVDDVLRRQLAFDGADTPALWALKVRALAAAGLTPEAASLLSDVPPSRLRDLPCDSQFLGTLGHLARATKVLGLRDYAVVLDELLRPYDAYFTGHASFLCDGAVPTLRGSLALMLGRMAEAHVLLERGLRMSEEAGYVVCVADARSEFRSCLRMLGHDELLDVTSHELGRDDLHDHHHGL